MKKVLTVLAKNEDAHTAVTAMKRLNSIYQSLYDPDHGQLFPLMIETSFGEESRKFEIDLEAFHSLLIIIDEELFDTTTKEDRQMRLF